jgi:protein TonB
MRIRHNNLQWMFVATFVTGLTAQTTASAPQPVRVSGGVIAGNVLTKVMPTFPVEAREKHINGSVTMRVVIGKDGHVKSAEAISGPNLLRQAFVDAVKQWTYKPYLLNGSPVEVETTITIDLQMNGG